MKIAETIYTLLQKDPFFTCSGCIVQLSEFLFRSKIGEIS